VPIAASQMRQGLTWVATGRGLASGKLTFTEALGGGLRSRANRVPRGPLIGHEADVGACALTLTLQSDANPVVVTEALVQGTSPGESSDMLGVQIGRVGKVINEQLAKGLDRAAGRHAIGGR
jgi:hypothetical protein